MSDAEHLNRILERTYPAAARCLSPVGRRAVFPRGIPFQSSEARGTQINATIGQITNIDGEPLPLPTMQEALHAVEPRMAYLYSPQAGHLPLRRAWAQRQRAHSGGSAASVSMPMVTNGLTQGLSIAAALFADDETELVVAEPYWENYDLLFGLFAQVRKRSYAFFRDGRFNVEGLADALSKVQGKAIVLLNFPSNPTGYTLGQDEVAQVVEVLVEHAHPSVVICDDAYQGLVFEEDRAERSLFWDLAERADPERLLPYKIDGATKELYFFAGRVGFITHNATGEAEDALLSKLKCIMRAQVGSPSGPAQSMVLRALERPGLDEALQERWALLRHRYQTLQEALQGLETDALTPYPFNSGCFALLQLREDIDAERMRQRLIQTQSVGVVAIPSSNALRVAYCSTDASQLPELVHRLAKAVD